ncbi:hypothetical protein EYF80_064943 [Liparis tanakae]|uniref:Uncharacterized protein n=1 Tax=Liparis tanakae TaxID=230148 RepID=A0A4Z2E844_9TELE|nr:hypothetical protein EYF80_064943 [Liparis tanakae]
MNVNKHHATFGPSGNRTPLMESPQKKSRGTTCSRFWFQEDCWESAGGQSPGPEPEPGGPFDLKIESQSRGSDPAASGVFGILGKNDHLESALR